MNWTPHDALRFHDWEIEMSRWYACGNIGPIPKKPKGYDLWKQGPDPLKLNDAATINCKGGVLINSGWTPSLKALIKTTHPHTLTQTHLNLTS